MAEDPGGCFNPESIINMSKNFLIAQTIIFGTPMSTKSSKYALAIIYFAQYALWDHIAETTPFQTCKLNIWASITRNPIYNIYNEVIKNEIKWNWTNDKSDAINFSKTLTWTLYKVPFDKWFITDENLIVKCWKKKYSNKRLVYSTHKKFLFKLRFFC